MNPSWMGLTIKFSRPLHSHRGSQCPILLFPWYHVSHQVWPTLGGILNVEVLQGPVPDVELTQLPGPSLPRNKLAPNLTLLLAEKENAAFSEIMVHNIFSSLGSLTRLTLLAQRRHPQSRSRYQSSLHQQTPCKDPWSHHKPDTCACSINGYLISISNL